MKGKKLSDLKGTKKFTKYDTNAEKQDKESNNLTKQNKESTLSPTSHSEAGNGDKTMTNEQKQKIDKALQITYTQPSFASDEELSLIANHPSLSEEKKSRAKKEIARRVFTENEKKEMSAAMPNLTGSEKQIEFANSKRESFVNNVAKFNFALKNGDLEDFPDELISKLQDDIKETLQKPDSKFWIESDVGGRNIMTRGIRNSINNAETEADEAKFRKMERQAFSLFQSLK